MVLRRFLNLKDNYEDEPPKKGVNLDLPLSRVKKIMTVDPEVEKIQKQALLATVGSWKRLRAAAFPGVQCCVGVSE